MPAVVPELAAVVTVVFFAVSVECNLAFVGFAAACEGAAKTYFAGLSCLESWYMFAEPKTVVPHSPQKPLGHPENQRMEKPRRTRRFFHYPLY
jgi:hypothetical protein